MPETDVPPKAPSGGRAVGAVVTAAGSGQRFGGLKQFCLLDGQAILSHAVAAAAAVASEIVVVVPPGEEERSRELFVDWKVRPAVIAGSVTRGRSVLAGLQALRSAPEWVVVHDGVRPRATPSLFQLVLAAAAETGAAIPVLPCADTVKRVEGQRVLETLDRSALRLVQTPQVFRRALLLDAFRLAGDREYTDEAALCEAAGVEVRVVAGERKNIKVTEPTDLAALAEGVPESIRGAPSTEGACRIGLGYDVHPFAPGRRLVLGGIEFPGDGLLGHSDADAVAHAVADAVLGAAGLGDLGRHFPDTDPRFRDSDSLELLKTVVARAAAGGYRVGNVDLTIAAHRPKIAPRAPEMVQRLAQALGVAPQQVNVKATTGERLGFVGREEGISVQAVALLWKR